MVDAVLAELDALLRLPLHDDIWRDHRIVQEGRPDCMWTIWPQLLAAHAQHKLIERDERKGVNHMVDEQKEVEAPEPPAAEPQGDGDGGTQAPEREAAAEQSE